MSKCHKINCKLNGIMMTSADIVVRFYKLLHDIIDTIIHKNNFLSSDTGNPTQCHNPSFFKPFTEKRGRRFFRNS